MYKLIIINDNEHKKKEKKNKIKLFKWTNEEENVYFMCVVAVALLNTMNKQNK